MLITTNCVNNQVQGCQIQRKKMHGNELFPKDSLSLVSPEGLLWLQHTIKPGTPELWNTEHWNTGRTPEHWWNIQLNIGRTVEIPWNSRTCEEQRSNVTTKQYQEIYQYRPMTY